jgi:hypothetical protein
MIYNMEYETMPREALEAIQLRRLQTTVERVYASVAVLSRSISTSRRLAGGHPLLGRSAASAVYHQAGSARQLPLRHVCRAHGSRRAHSRLLRHHRATHRGGVHGPRHADMGAAHGPFADGRRRQSRRHHPQCLRLRPVYRRIGRALRRRAVGRIGDSRSPAATPAAR